MLLSHRAQAWGCLLSLSAPPPLEQATTQPEAFSELLTLLLSDTTWGTLALVTPSMLHDRQHPLARRISCEEELEWGGPQPALCLPLSEAQRTGLKPPTQGSY